MTLSLIYMFGFILLSSLQHFISLDDWSHRVERFALSECILFVSVLQFAVLCYLYNPVICYDLICHSVCIELI